MARTEKENAENKAYEPQQNRTPDGQIDILYYYNACIDIIERNAAQDGRDTNKITTNQLIFYFTLCYQALFKPLDSTTQGKPNNIYSDIPASRLYHADDIKALIELYLMICQKYDALPGYYNASRLLGINDDVLKQYEVTSGNALIAKMRKAYIQNRLNNNIIGVMSLANNDIDTGLLYTRQNIVAHEVVKRSLSFDDLQRIAQQAPGLPDNDGNM